MPGWNDAAMKLIESALGENSRFAQTFGYYADTVEESTATLPSGWSKRLIAIYAPETGGCTGWCLEPHDLVISKAAAGREKDMAFCRALLRTGRARKEVLLSRLEATSLSPEKRDIVRGRIEREFEAAPISDALAALQRASQREEDDCGPH